MKRLRSLLRGIRPAVASYLMLAVLTGMVASPLMERADVGRETSVEREHDPESCLPHHDHTLCIQLGANHLAPASPAARPAPAPAVKARATTERARIDPAPTRPFHHPRGPPRA